MGLGTHIGCGRGCSCGEEDRGAEVGGREGPKEVAGVWHVVCVQVVVRVKSRESGRVDERRRAGLLLTLEEVELNLEGWLVFHFDEHLWKMEG